MNRRGFLGAIIAAGAAPAIVRADSLMRVVTRLSGLITYGWVEISQQIIVDSDWKSIEYEPAAWVTNPELMERMAQNIMKNNAILRRVRAAKPFTGGLLLRDE